MIIDGWEMEKTNTFEEKSDAHNAAHFLRRKFYLVHVIESINGFEVWKTLDTVKNQRRIVG